MTAGDATRDARAAALELAVAIALDADVVRRVRLGGGDVSESYRIDLAGRSPVFAKTHHRPPPQCFSTEARSLAWLREPGVVRVPAVLAVSDGDDGRPAFLALEWIDEQRSTPGRDADLGRALAALHQAGARCFGRDDRRTTGSRSLPNDPCSTWSEFYAGCRLLPLARMARDTGSLDGAVVRGLERVATRLDELGGPPEPPARLHGDLWAGNRLVDRSGTSWLIDPAAHGGHREFDLAMMRLFGGFGAEVFAAYDDVFPLADEWQARVALHQLAPLVVHAIKFGGGYVAATARALATLT